MAYLKWTTGRYMFVVILVDMWAHAASGVLIVKPQDTYVLAGQVATLNCSTSSTEDVHWYYGTSYVYAGRKLYSPYKDRLKIDVYQIDDITAFNLVFPSAKPEDAGMYNCLDDQGRGETSSAEVTVFTADGNGTCKSNMKPDGVVIPNDCNIDPDEVQLSCSVTYYGNNPPQLQWKKVPVNGNSVANTECQTINNRIVCNASIIGDRQMNRSSYVCQTAGSSQLNISLCTISVKNLIYAFSGKTTKKSSVGNEVQCNLDTSQSCNYKWKHSDIVVSTSRTITPDRTGLYQCEAECNIRGKRCIVFDYAYISDEDSTDSISCSTGCVVGICVGILLLVIIILTVIHCFLLRKEKGKNQQLQNRSPPLENGTQEELTDLIPPQEKIKTNNPTNNIPVALETAPLEIGTHAESIATNQEMEATKSLRRRLVSEGTDDRESLPRTHRRAASFESTLSIVDEPILIRTLLTKAASTKKKAVFGMAILSEEVFVLSYHWLKIEVFGDLEKLESRREFSLTGHELEIPWDIQSSYKHECLYIVDKKRNEDDHAEIIKIDPKGNVKKRWTTECIAGRLSVTKEFNVIFTPLYKRRMYEYSPDGDLIRFIELLSDVGIVSPWLTLKRSKDEYIVSHGDQGDSQHGVCVINQNGNTKKSFIGRKGSRNDQLNVPVHMAAYSDGHILVADKENRRVVLLSPELKFIQAWLLPGDWLRTPNRVCLDEQNQRLFVSDNQWISTTKPWSDGRVLVYDMSSVRTSLKIAVDKKLYTASYSTP